ncbi:putative Lipoate-protein ligase [Gigaspora margarita]|uniref:lipoyl(octanoyl) transferase n=2 Tax=Gigaspora margarita TaxID=4874 RepID=A0A8H3XI26_GIGMA|nr:putative Lipoate-protein ligase [Gigaspora margarita]
MYSTFKLWPEQVNFICIKIGMSLFFSTFRNTLTGIPTSILPYVYLSQISYEKALNLQKLLVRRRFENKNSSDLLLLLQHPPTFTTGRRDIGKTMNDEAYLRKLGAEYFETLRGGQTTFHGPGQLVGYPILDLRNFKLSVRCYVAAIEHVIINTCNAYGIVASTTKNTGVWVGDDKICAIGIQVQRFITSHGFALNCNTDLNWFDHIIPCGLEDKKMTSLTNEYAKEGKKTIITVEQVIPTLCQHFGYVFGRPLKPLKDVNNESDRALMQILDEFLMI